VLKAVKPPVVKLTVQELQVAEAPPVVNDCRLRAPENAVPMLLIADELPNVTELVGEVVKLNVKVSACNQLLAAEAMRPKIIVFLMFIRASPPRLS
jgi:hypothetical protein